MALFGTFLTGKSKPSDRAILGVVFGLTARGRSVVAFGAFGVWWGGWGALLPAVQRSADVDDGRLGVALLLIGVGALVSMRVTGYLVDRFGGAVLPISVVAWRGGDRAGVRRGGGVLWRRRWRCSGVASGAYDVAVNAEASRLETMPPSPC